MFSEPAIEIRPPRAYFAIPATVTMTMTTTTIGAVLPPLMPHVFAGLAANGVHARST
jgi:hypothetical protein